ncbi:hypothetical protein EYF80_015353 [Liparis tanakae]|uniref:Uncharacterized protein n=1 Tax=Liparis tanakae TaxID=230148 RepID=A0A4Z2IAR6_9TELE|nr:hypothetical protein EYF80_015353 [Liparis tanakae]
MGYQGECRQHTDYKRYCYILHDFFAFYIRIENAEEPVGEARMAGRRSVCRGSLDGVGGMFRFLSQPTRGQIAGPQSHTFPAKLIVVKEIQASTTSWETLVKGLQVRKALVNNGIHFHQIIPRQIQFLDGGPGPGKALVHRANSIPLQVQVTQIGDRVECGVVERRDLVGTQDQLLEPADTLKGQYIHRGNVIVVQVEPDEVVEAYELAGAKTDEAVVAQGEAFAASGEVLGDIAEGA